MPYSNKRRRGRPRRGEGPTIDPFDMALAREFQQRPAFYDRTHPQYRNREYLEPIWSEIAENLSSNVAVVKNRMVQLRNRYNLEKRRVESLQEQYNDPDITSHWPMYEYLTYLGGHIKSRRTYAEKTALLQPKLQPISGTSDSDDCDNSNLYESKSVSARRPGQQHHELLQIRPDTAVTVSNHQQQQQQQQHQQQQLQQHSYVSGLNDPAMLNLAEDGNASVYKFKAFGQFLASSLIEMNEIDALRLVEKFTTELVKSLLSEQKLRHQNNDGTTATVDGLVNGHEY